MIPKTNYDKISKYRQKIKQNIIYQQNAGQNIIPPKQQLTPRQSDNYLKIQSSLSRSNIRKNPNDIQTPRNYQEQQQLYPQPKSHRNRVFEPYVPNQSKPIEKINIIEPKINDHTRNSDPIRIVDQRTTQKPLTSKSPSNRNPYFQERQALTKRKNSPLESNIQTGNRGLYQKNQNFNNTSSFQTFNQKPLMSSSVLPPLFAPLSPSNATGQQVKILLEENQILSLHLNEKMERIKNLQKQLQAVVKSEILHEQKYDIEVSQLLSQKQMIKKSTDEQVKTLVMQVKKLNDELIQKQQEWQERLNKVRKNNLDEQQEAKKYQILMQQKYKKQLQQLRIQIQKINEEFKASKDQSSAIISNLKAENLSLNQSIEKFAHIHKMQKSQLTLSHQNALRQIKEEHYKKTEIMNLDRIRKENEQQNTIDQLNKQIGKLNDQLSLLKHQRQFSQVKQMQQRGKMIIQLREEKLKIQNLKLAQNQKKDKISQAQLQTVIKSYQSQISQLQNQIQNLQKLLQARGMQIKNLYGQIKDTRLNYQQQLVKKQGHITNLSKKMEDISNKNLEEQQCLKIKLAELTQSNQISLKEIYQKNICQLKHLNLDKDQIIKSLRQKISDQLLQIEQNNLVHYQQVKQMQTKIEKLQQQLTSNALKQRNMNVSSDKQNMILKQNLVRQQQAYEKVTLVKEENLKRLQKIIQTKDKQIQDLQKKLQLLKKTHKDQLSLQKEQYETTIREKDDSIVALKIQLQYSRKQQTKRAQQFSHDKQYFSNQLRQLKHKGEKDFNQWVDNLSSEINVLKTQNQDLKYQLQQAKQQYQEYKKLWNENQTLNKLADKEKEFMQKLNVTFTQKYQKLIQSHQKDIEANYMPKIKNLTELLNEKEQQIIDMKTNYHELEMKFQKFMEEKQIQNALNDQVLTLGKQNSILAKNFVTLGK